MLHKKIHLPMLPLVLLFCLFSGTLAHWEIGMIVRTLSFAPFSKIPPVFSCSSSNYNVSFPYGRNMNPGFGWNKPASDNATISYALVLHDPDASPVVGFPFLHWGVLNIPASVLSIYEVQKKMPAGSFEIYNPMTGATGYYGLCPPAGRHHIYRALVFARDQMENPSTFPFKKTANAEELISHLMMDGHTLAVGENGAVFP